MPTSAPAARASIDADPALDPSPSFRPGRVSDLQVFARLERHLPPMGSVTVPPEPVPSARIDTKTLLHSHAAVAVEVQPADARTGGP